jgi:putative ABC transport system ATP-binding protein
VGKFEMAVRVEDVKKIYRIGKIAVNALRGVNMTINKGEVVAIMGPSGSGKSSLLNLIGTLDQPTEGKVYVDEADISEVSERERTQLRRNKIGFIFQFYNLIPVLTAYENVELPMVIAGKPKKSMKPRIEHLLKMVGLTDRANHRPDELSGGEQQRVAIIRALANAPSILLADEPTGDLDTKTANEVMRYLLESSKQENVTVILVTHDPNVAKMANRVFRMQDGIIKDTITNNSEMEPTHDEQQLIDKLEQTHNKAVQLYTQELKKITQQIADIRAALKY